MNGASPAHSSVSTTAVVGGGGSSGAAAGLDDFHFPPDIPSMQERKDEALRVLKADLMGELEKEVKSLEEDSWMFDAPRSRIHLISRRASTCKPKVWKITLVRERRLQEPLTLSIPPPPPSYHRTTSGDPSPSFSSSSSPDTPPVETLDDLEKLTVLGHGSGGTVYKTCHRRTKRLYALKVLRSTTTTTNTVEADILKQIESSFIVKCYAIFVNSPDLCFVMELMDKGSLHDMLLARHVFSELEISNLAYRILQGLRYLQEMRIVHGDIKPSNLLVNEKGEVKVADFGASRIVAGGEYGSNGTRAYVSPERTDPEKWGAGEVGFAGDVWSLGVVVLECYLGRYPLIKIRDKPDWTALICAISNAEKVEIPVSGSPEFRGFVETCLEKDWRKRGTVEELLFHPFVRNK